MNRTSKAGKDTRCGTQYRESYDIINDTERVDRVGWSVGFVSRTMRDQLTKLVGAKFQTNRRKEFVMQQAVDLLRRYFPKHPEDARNLHADSSVWRGKPQQVQEIL